MCLRMHTLASLRPTAAICAWLHVRLPVWDACMPGLLIVRLPMLTSAWPLPSLHVWQALVPRARAVRGRMHPAQTGVQLRDHSLL